MMKSISSKIFLRLFHPKLLHQQTAAKRCNEKHYNTSASTEEDDVLSKENGNGGLIVLNRPKTLNALNVSMIKKINNLLTDWEKSKKIVIIKGAGNKAFCAGGDVKHITLALKNPGGEKVGADFFRNEYTLDYLIGTYKKCYVALMDGITMGGGVGISVHGKYRIATEKTLFAMPETNIGLFPDVGASYFLPRLPGKLGLFLGLTGHRLKGEDVKLAGIATHFVNSSKLDELIEQLFNANHTDVDKILKNFESKDQFKSFSLNKYLEKINKCFSGNSVEKIIAQLKQDNSQWANEVLENLSKMSPTSLKITKKSYENGANLTLKECLQMEYRLGYRACNIKSDFYEGVRSVLIDKDYKPVWNPKTVEEVTDEFIQNQFKLLPSEIELKL